MIPPVLLCVLNTPVIDILKYIISSIINITIKNNNIDDKYECSQPLIIIKTNLGIQITKNNIGMKVGILNMFNSIIVTIVSIIVMVNSGSKFIFNAEYNQAIIGVITACVFAVNLYYLATRFARVFGKK